MALEELVSIDDIIALEPGTIPNFAYLQSMARHIKSLSRDFRWQGEWDNATEYEHHDVVAHNDIAWIALVANTASEPTDANSDWDTFVSGAAWHTVAADPGAALGEDGHLALQTAAGSTGVAGDVWLKSAGAWSIILNLQGPQGIQGIQGDNVNWIVGAGAPGSGTGEDGDMYLDSTTGDVYGPKAAGAWGGVAANIEGPQGEPGDMTNVFSAPLATDSGTDAYQVDLGGDVSSGQTFLADVGSANTTASPTLENTGGTPSGAQSIVTTAGAAFDGMLEARPHRFQWDGTNFVVLDPAGGAVEKGSNANGEYIHFADGTLICRHVLTITYDANSHLRGVWTYPKAFSAVPSLSAVVDLDTTFSNATPQLHEITNTFVNGETASSSHFRTYRVSGGTNFQSGDTSDLRVIAIGKA